jgi:hypothetical protein
MATPPSARRHAGEHASTVAGLRRRRRSTAPPSNTWPAQREVLSQGEAFAILLPHENTPQVGVSAEANAEHVVALALEPIGALEHGPHTVGFEWRARRDLGFEAKEPAVGERPEMPDDGQRLFGITELHRGDVRQVRVEVARIVVEPAHDVEDPLPRDDDGSLAPHDLDAADGVRELRANGGSARVFGTAAVRDTGERRRPRCARIGAPRIHDAGWRLGRRLQPGTHSPDRVWLTELPNGSESSSIAGGGMNKRLDGSGSISRRSRAVSDMRSRMTFSWSMRIP